ncbi:serine/threonine protein kinase [Leptolyngbya valderiana BDU 20041]|uniref:ATP-binding protein n=1 Tax=Baaleninema simplex TaxID=2862350 RepID=UPI00034A40E2|nr:anti-sigma regulatory factor [Baaleninema simplex]MDC0835478.1 anti-sigma regulatory factor [Geitlerinema sp. CS-897]OAB60808.1 serine/threonine protein kinase [Leptolyngbya valderiana BDU 20041]PPT11042.1 Anti-sigma regulatory factor (Ser/Thr protein kinase) essential for photomixotrophic growth PmgA [Geitlerinema sp. FC II]
MVFSVMALPMPSTGRCQGTVSFASTLYLCPILDLLLAEIPASLQPEIRLGLQEALVNAATHGNQLDPGKTITVEFSFSKDIYWWTISDRGDRPFDPEACCCASADEDSLPDDTSECGRGLYILNQIFDRVEWTPQKRQLRLGKLVPRSVRRPKF